MEAGITLRAASIELVFETLMRNALRKSFMVERIVKAGFDDSFALELIRACKSSDGLDFVESTLDSRGCATDEALETLYLEAIDWGAVGKSLRKPDQEANQDAKPESSQSFAYFIESGVTGLIKIGRSVDPESRLKALQTASPDKLTLLKVIPEQVVSESELHERFSHLRRQGEWFESSEEIREFIKSH